eukprot:1416006-Prymnesium_polylepis.1
MAGPLAAPLPACLPPCGQRAMSCTACSATASGTTLATQPSAGAAVPARATASDERPDGGSSDGSAEPA